MPRARNDTLCDLRAWAGEVYQNEGQLTAYFHYV